MESAILAQQQVARVRARSAEKLAREKLQQDAGSSRTSGWQSVVIPVVGLLVVAVAIAAAVSARKR